MGGNTSRVTAQDKAILDMKNQRDKLHQYQRRITVLTDKETDIAKQMLAKGDKKRALLALRRKKYQESLLAKTDAQLEQLEKLTSNVEFALIQKDVVFGLQQGTKVLKEIHAEMGGLENVEKLMGETADAIAYQQVCMPFCGDISLLFSFLLWVWIVVTHGYCDKQEVSDMLGGQISNQDEEEVEDELAALQGELAGEGQQLPSVPNVQVPISERPEEEEPAREARQMLAA
ncbi:Vacuolar protein sorting-associated protein 20 [Metarhizium acridum]|uniref:Vacuolar protein sorting-associated protein 20 n=1 Tax=Metarhizium acridum TaxID=92637 RepID=UPI001C6AF142|nr:Vacuolar protein sorting-associated protein 20 [Metarhizium acridum]KAG8427908.1 Vacuolar protein sorting-associated protein 20 [Metarhizium acridum]